MLAELAPFALLALFGALHCAAMCGGFLVALDPRSGASRRRVIGRQLAFVLGKALTYAVLALLVARAGNFAEGIATRSGSASFEAVQDALAVAAGLGIVSIGLRACGWRPRPPEVLARATAALLRPLEVLRRGAGTLPGGSGALALGMIGGLLPCGLSSAAILLALQTRSPAIAAAGTFAFGVATAPALVLAGSGWRLLPVSWRPRAARFLGPALVLLGILTITRGSPFRSWQPLQARLPECCRRTGSD